MHALPAPCWDYVLPVIAVISRINLLNLRFPDDLE